jgi:hypothetical protein
LASPISISGAWAARSRACAKSVEINPNGALSQFVLAGALALNGVPAEAAEVYAAARRLSPNFTIAKFRAEAVSDNPVYLAQRERLHEGLRLAGVPRAKQDEVRRVCQSNGQSSSCATTRAPSPRQCGVF